MNDQDCLFCRIIAGEIPSCKIYEDSRVFAFLDINPVDKGHTLIVPKEHHDCLLSTPDRVVAAAMVRVRMIAQAIVDCGFDGVNLLQSNYPAAGQTVPHLHFHLIPRMNSADGPKWVSGGAKYKDDAERDAYAERIREAVAARAAKTPLK